MKHTCPRKECDYVTPDWAAFELHMSKHNYDDAKLLQSENAALRSEIANYETARQEDARRMEKVNGERDEIKRLAKDVNSLLNSTMTWMQEEGIAVPFIMTLMIGSLGEKSEKLAATLKDAK